MHSVFIIKTKQLMQYREIVAVCSENDMKCKNNSMGKIQSCLVLQWVHFKTEHEIVKYSLSIFLN